MANYYAHARSNYFKVKDASAFEKFCRCWRLEKIDDSGGRVGFLVQNDGGLSDEYLDPETDKLIEADFEQALTGHLKPGEVAVIMQVGYEKLRYLTGWAWAVNADGKTVHCDISEIYNLAKALKPDGEITLCEY